MSENTADVTFPTDLDGLEVGEVAGLIDFEGEGGYGRIGIKRKPQGVSDELVLQTPTRGGYRTINVIAEVGRWFARGDVDWGDVKDAFGQELPA